MGLRLANRIAVVTGASQGIGRAVTQLFVEEGATVIAIARGADALQNLASDIAAAPGRVIPTAGDITDPDFVAKLFADLREIHGRIDILVNNAGNAPFGSITTMDPAKFRSCLELNIWAVFLCTQQAVRLMLEMKTAGKIVNIGSVRSHWTESGDSGAYNASKYGVRGFTESVARELHGGGSKIAVSLVCPGVVNTPLTNPGGEPRPTWLEPATVAQAVLHNVTAPPGVNIYDTVLIPTEQKPW